MQNVISLIVVISIIGITIIVINKSNNSNSNSSDISKDVKNVEEKCDYFGYDYNREANKISDIELMIEAEENLSVKLQNNDKTWAEIFEFEIKNFTEESKSA